MEVLKEQLFKKIQFCTFDVLNIKFDLSDKYM